MPIAKVGRKENNGRKELEFILSVYESSQQPECQIKNDNMINFFSLWK